MNIYISGKITGLENYKEKFNKAEKDLRANGHSCMNPSVLPGDFPWEACMKIAYAMIDACDAIYLLNNWRDSKGAVLEYDYAITNGKQVIYEDGYYESIARVIPLNKIQEHKRICSEMSNLYERKNHDYGDSFAKVRKAVGPNAIVVRLYDKIERLNTLLGGAEQKVKDESIDDCFMDLANYCILELIERKVDKEKLICNTQGVSINDKKKELAKGRNLFDWNKISCPTRDPIIKKESKICFDNNATDFPALSIGYYNGNSIEIIDTLKGQNAIDLYNILNGANKRMHELTGISNA